MRKMNSSIYHIENLIPKQKVKCTKPPPQAKKIKTFHMIEIKWGIRICC